MGVLVHLAEHAGEVITREQFIERVWQGRIVSDEVLSRCISLLRTHLGDSPREPRYIQTMPKIGYRLVAPVERLGHAHPDPVPQPTNVADTVAVVSPLRRFRPMFVLALTAVIALLSAWAIMRLTTDSSVRSVTGESAMVVLPFVNVSDDPENEYFSDGLTEELIQRLARVPGLRVVARTTTFALKEKHDDVRTLARRLGVDYVLEGSVRKEGGQVRISAQLTDAKQGFSLWSQRFEIELGRIFSVQDEIASAIVAQLQPRLAGNTAATMDNAPPTGVIAAYELVLRGRYHLQRRDEAPIRRSIGLFEQALTLDPRFVDAHCDLARAYALLPYYSYEDREEMFDVALATIERGAKVDPRVREAAQDTIAFISYGRRQWIEAQEGFHRALAANPSDPNLHEWYSQLLASVGDSAGSLEHAQLAQKFDVLSPVVNHRLAIAYLWVDDDERAHSQFGVADELGLGPGANPEAHLVSLLRQHDYPRARELMRGLQKLLGRTDEWVDPFLAALQDPAARPAAISAVTRAVESSGISLKHQFGAWAYLGEADRAMAAAFELIKDPTEFNVEFLFARETAVLRQHPRFGDLIVALGLDRYWDRYGWPTQCARRGHAIECR